MCRSIMTLGTQRLWRGLGVFTVARKPHGLGCRPRMSVATAQELARMVKRLPPEAAGRCDAGSRQLFRKKFGDQTPEQLR